MVKTVQITIHGKVHGVGFRFSSYDKFVEYGLEGKAENGKDGTVVVVATGEETVIQQFLLWAHTGPEGARVEKVECIDIPTPAEIKNK